MKSMRFRSSGALTWILPLCCLVVLAACKAEEKTEPAAEAVPEATPEVTQTETAPPAVAIDACSLLTQEEVQAVVGRAVLPPQKEEIPQFAACGYGDPESPLVEGRSLSHVVKIGVMVGEEGAYYAGAVAQAKDGFEMARKNAASPEAVVGLGDDAYWDATFGTLNVLKANYWVDVTLSSDAGGVEMAKTLAAKVLERLP